MGVFWVLYVIGLLKTFFIVFVSGFQLCFVLLGFFLCLLCFSLSVGFCVLGLYKVFYRVFTLFVFFYRVQGGMHVGVAMLRAW